MFSYMWPIALVVLSNTVYQICAKEVSPTINPFASLVITYLVGAAASAVLYFSFQKGGSLFKEFAHINWASFALGLAIVGLEVGFIFAYQVGWKVSTASVVQSAFLSLMLVVVGLLLYHEPITRNKVIGVVFCLIGLLFLNQ